MGTKWGQVVIQSVIFVKWNESEVNPTKILIYTDLHCSYNSSILPLYQDTEDKELSKYTVRLRMIIETGRWLAELASSHNVDCIVNGGDTFDSTIVKAEELEAIYKFFSYFDNLGIPHYVVVGNHEKVNERFNASEVLSGYKNVIVCDKPSKINDVLSVLPYMDAEDITEDLLKSIQNQMLVSHIDIKGSMVREGMSLETGIRSELLADYFSFVANGHLHMAQKLNTTKNEVWNIGSVSSISFADSESYTPSAVIYDSDTNKFERIFNPYAILFRRVEVSTVNDLKNFLNSLNEDRFRYVFNVKYSNYEDKQEMSDLLDSHKGIITYKLLNSYTSSENATIENVEVNNLSDIDIKAKFTEFLETIDFKYDRKYYDEILSQIG